EVEDRVVLIGHKGKTKLVRMASFGPADGIRGIEGIIYDRRRTLVTKAKSKSTGQSDTRWAGSLIGSDADTKIGRLRQLNSRNGLRGANALRRKTGDIQQRWRKHLGIGQSSVVTVGRGGGWK